MQFNVSSSSVTEGDIIEVRWQGAGATQVQLTIDSGYKSSTLPLDAEGAKRFRLNRSKRHTVLTLAWVENGHTHTKKQRVRVKPIPVANAEYIDDQGRATNGIGGWWRRARQKIGTTLAQWRNQYDNATPDKQLALRACAMLVGVILLSLLLPTLTLALVLVVATYLMMYYFRKQ